MIELKKIRKGLGLSQIELAEILDCSQNYISKIEKGQRSAPLEFYTKLKEVYGAEKIGKLNTSFLLSKMGWRNPSDPDFQTVREDLLSLLDKIMELTGLDITEISFKIYGNYTRIQEQIEHDQITPHMTTKIMENLEKVGLKKSNVLSDFSKKTFFFQSPSDFEAYLNSSNHNKFLQVDMTAVFGEFDFVLVLDESISSDLQIGTILVLNKLSSEDLSPTKEYYSLDYKTPQLINLACINDILEKEKDIVIDYSKVFLIKGYFNPKLL